jgi:hypothetical protein
VIVQQYRGTGAYGPYVAQNNYIHNNSITHLGNVGASGIVEDFTTPDAFNNNNRFDYNNYHVADSNQGRWAWSNSLRNWSGFRAYSQEANGSVDGTIIP